LRCSHLIKVKAVLSPSGDTEPEIIISRSEMKQNVGIVDLVVRSLLGIGILAYLTKDGTFAPGSAPGVIIAVVLIATAILKYCPLYRLLGFSTSGPVDRSA
jgi:Inner membrane protein YgaP-like, transmembrane domain